MNGATMVICHRDDDGDIEVGVYDGSELLAGNYEGSDFYVFVTTLF